MQSNSKAILAIFAYGTLEDQKNFILQCPDSNTKPYALQFIDFHMPNSNLAALDALCNGYNGKSNHLDLAIVLAQVLKDTGTLQYQNKAVQKEESLDYAINGAYFLVKFLFDGSRYEEAMYTADSVVDFLQPPVRYQFERLCVIELYKTEALLMLSRFEEARICFEQAKSLGFSAASKIQRDNLERNLDKIFNQATELRNPDQIADDFNEGNQAALAAIEALAKSMGDGAQNPLLSGILAELNQLSQNTGALQESGTDTSATLYQENNAASQNIYDSFKGHFGPNDLHEVQQRVQQSCTIFHDPQRAQNPDALAKTIQELTDVCQTVETKNIPYDLQTVWWAMGVCHNRLKQYREGLALTEKIWAQIEFQRSQIENYTERAGLLNKFEYLFTRLCDFYYQLGDTQGMLNAIESSKGRVLADVLDRQQHPSQPIPAVSDFTKITADLPSIMHQMRANYLTFLLEEDYIYAVLVSSKGNLFHKKIEIGKAHLQQWLSAQMQNPQKWQSRSTGLFGKKQEVDMTLSLAPLVSWLLPLIESGEIAEGEHLCYCPDGDLSLFPLHYVKINGRYLIEQFTISRTQGAYTLVQSLQQEAQTPSKFTSLVAYAVEDLEDVEKMTGFKLVTNYLSGVYPGTTAEEEDTDLRRLLSLAMAGNVIHFTTHGTFPTNDTGNPYTDSGLLIFDGNQRPSLDKLNSNNVLTPERLLSAKIDFTLAHISLQACVSGRSKEGVGGDALGLEWAFLLSGASSLLASNWDVDYRFAAQFCIHFYENWLKKGLSRAQAFQQAALTIMNGPLPAQHVAPYYWAGFSLMGDWR